MDNPNCTGVAAQLHSTELEMKKVEEVGRKIDSLEELEEWANRNLERTNAKSCSWEESLDPIWAYWYTDIVEGKSFVEKDGGGGGVLTEAMNMNQQYALALKVNGFLSCIIRNDYLLLLGVF